MLPDRIECSTCKVVIDPSLDTPERRAPCPTCGALARTMHASINEASTARDGIGFKAKRPGKGRPFIEDRAMPSYSFVKAKTVLREQIIDRDVDRYFERVTDYETGEVIHECDEALTKHRGHGSAKKSRPEGYG